MALHKDNAIFQILEGSAVIPWVGTKRRATLLFTPQNTTHDRTISTLNNAIQTINLINDIIPFPVVQGVLSSIAGVLGIVKNTFDNQGDFQELIEQCQMIGLVVWHATSGTPEHQLDPTLYRALVNLRSSVDGILDAVKAKAEKNLGSKVFHVTVNQEIIMKWRNDLNQLLTLFNTELSISANLKLGELLSSFQESHSKVIPGLPTDTQAPDVLPARPKNFVGRDDLVGNTMQHLLECRHVALIGPGGIGKSCIARAVLNDEKIASKFQDRRFFVRFDDMDITQVNLGTFLDRIARALGLATSVNARNMITRVLSTSATLLVLDNAETFLDAAVDVGRMADAIDGFGALSNVAILLTTRTTVLPPNLECVRLRVPVLDESAACEAFRVFYPAIETSILIEMLSAVDFHPLSINLLAQAAIQNEWSAQELATACDRKRAALLEAGDGKVQSIPLTIETSLNSPSFVKRGETMHHLLQMIAFLPQGISRSRLAAIFPGISNIQSCADALCRQSLAYLDNDFITTLAPIRLYISNRYNRETSMNPLLRAIRSYYASHIQEPTIVVRDDVNIEHVLIHWLGDSETKLDVLEYINCFVITLCEYRPRAVALRQVISALDVRRPYFPVSCMNFSMTIPILRKSKALILAKSGSLLFISVLLWIIGQKEEAQMVHTEARLLALEVGDANHLAFMDWGLAIIYLEQGNFAAAGRLSKTALKHFSYLSRLFNRDRCCLRAFLKLHILQLDVVKGKPDVFQRYLNALPAFKKACYPINSTKFFFMAGFTALHDGDLNLAKKCFREIQAGVNKDECAWLRASMGLADIADRQGDSVGSKALRGHLLQSAEEMFDQRREGVYELIALLAGYLALDGNVEAARRMIVPIMERTTVHLSMSTVRCRYMAGMVELNGGDLNQARIYFRETIEECMFLDELLSRARSHRALGEIAVIEQDMVAATKHFETTTEFCKTMGVAEDWLYRDFICCIPSKRFDGWRLYQEGHVMFTSVQA